MRIANQTIRNSLSDAGDRDRRPVKRNVSVVLTVVDCTPCMPVYSGVNMVILAMSYNISSEERMEEHVGFGHILK